jgi:hypothetical protein
MDQLFGLVLGMVETSHSDRDGALGDTDGRAPKAERLATTRPCWRIGMPNLTQARAKRYPRPPLPSRSPPPAPQLLGWLGS